MLQRPSPTLPAAKFNNTASFRSLCESYISLTEAPLPTSKVRPKRPFGPSGGGGFGGGPSDASSVLSNIGKGQTKEAPGSSGGFNKDSGAFYAALPSAITAVAQEGKAVSDVLGNVPGAGFLEKITPILRAGTVYGAAKLAGESDALKGEVEDFMKKDNTGSRRGFGTLTSPSTKSAAPLSNPATQPVRPPEGAPMKFRDPKEFFDDLENEEDPLKKKKRERPFGLPETSPTSSPFGEPRVPESPLWM